MDHCKAPYVIIHTVATVLSHEDIEGRRPHSSTTSTEMCTGPWREIEPLQLWHGMAFLA